MGRENRRQGGWYKWLSRSGHGQDQPHFAVTWPQFAITWWQSAAICHSSSFFASAVTTRAESVRVGSLLSQKLNTPSVWTRFRNTVGAITWAKRAQEIHQIPPVHRAINQASINPTQLPQYYCNSDTYHRKWYEHWSVITDQETYHLRRETSSISPCYRPLPISFAKEHQSTCIRRTNPYLIGPWFFIHSLQVLKEPTPI